MDRKFKSVILVIMLIILSLSMLFFSSYIKINSNDVYVNIENNYYIDLEDLFLNLSLDSNFVNNHLINDSFGRNILVTSVNQYYLFIETEVNHLDQIDIILDVTSNISFIVFLNLIVVYDDNDSQRWNYDFDVDDFELSEKFEKGFTFTYCIFKIYLQVIV